MHSSYSPLFTLGLHAERRAGLSSQSAPADHHPSAFYFTLQMGQRDTVEFRSFLSLDLADSSRSIPSHRRKQSNVSKSTSWTCTSNVTSDLSRNERPFARLPPLPLHRSSRESLRQIPSPKPAPASTLPELPTSPPKPLPSSAPLLSPKGSSLRSSSITSHQRRKSRMDALACLEGRSRANRIPRSNLRNNFMSMSDDEEEEAKAQGNPCIQVEDFGSFADIEDEGDAVVPSPKHFPPKQTSFPRSVSVSQPAKRQRRSTVESWFPLKSFIDLKDDDLSWNWRSFIEIGGIS
ncbi:hypothetical protein P692DRAFT_20863828 [Suillus brevipes Sb2]|nr:hypothetical protein P692DRAFT_20863828 [Suillus brevipes Sb2]